MASPAKKIAILGGGITGLSAAYRLSQEGHVVRVFEKESSIGGSIKTEIAQGWLIEKGPNSLQETPELKALIEELGLNSERIEASTTAKKRFLVKRSKLEAVPMGPGSFFKTSLFSASAKFRIFKELLFKKKNRTGDVSLATFVRDHFGSEILDQAVQPLISGIYAGDPELLSVTHAFPKLLEFEKETGSLIRGMIRSGKKKEGKKTVAKLISFKSGLYTLPHTLAAKLPSGSIEVEASVIRISRDTSWSLTYTQAGLEKTENFDFIISALPASALSALNFTALDKKPLAVLSTIKHPAVSSLFLGFNRSAIKHPLDGFGALIPSKEKKNALGILFSSSLFEGRAPKDCAALTVMVGGSLNSDLALKPTEVILDKVMPELRELLQVSESPLFIRHTAWPKAIAQYNLGYEAIRDAISSTEADYPGFFVGGQLRDGISVPDCIQSGFKLAQKVQSQLK